MRSITHRDVMRSVQLAGRVTRFHTWPMIRKPTTAEHQARVATLYCKLWGIPRGEVLYYCLHHDNGELNGGDTPHYAKRDSPMLKEGTNRAEEAGLVYLGITMPELTKIEFKRFKMADYLEMWETAVVERNMGNLYADPIMDNLRGSIAKLAEELCETNKINSWIRINLPCLT